uniref:Putative secreted protein n=1 Tax=Amblyomma americanum TaxID=6943 RepID=A0A0C9SCM9_AMBAM
MRRYLVWAVIFLLCVHSLMPSVSGCNPKARPRRTKKDPWCVGVDCHQDVCGYEGCNGCVGANLWCHGYCTRA